MLHIIKNILVVALALAMIAFSWLILSNTEYFNFFSKNKSTNSQNQEIVTLQEECPSYQYLENGICKDITYTCQNGEIVNDSSKCSIPVVASTTDTSVVSTSTDVVTTQASSSKNSVSKTTVVVEKNPKIQSVKVVSGGKNMTVSISGINFDKNTNIVTLIAGSDITKKMTLPAYPAPNNTQVITFQMTDFRSTYAGVYSFQIEAKGKISNVFNVTK